MAHDGSDSPPPGPLGEVWSGLSGASDSGADWGEMEDDGAGAPAPQPDLAGSPGEAERYARGALLGKGGMGEVFVATDQLLQRQVALKQVLPQSGAQDEAKARLAREARITAQLEHPNIVPVHDAGQTEDGRPFYTMRLIRGRALDVVLRETPAFSARLRLLRPFLDACQAVAYAHSIGIVHRDIKPANIMIGEFGETQVVDWGLARPSDTPEGERWGDQALTAKTPPGLARSPLVGTPAYMSPEQASGEEADARSDVWMLGAVLYELLTLQPPFTGRDAQEVLKRLRTQEPAPIRALTPEAPPELVAIAEQALRRDPDQRYPDARALVSDLSRYMDGLHVRAYTYTPLDHLRRFLSAWRVPALVAAVALAVIAAVVASSMRRSAHERDRARALHQLSEQALARADDNLALALVQQSRVAVGVYARPEAEVLATHALTLGDSPEARGLLAAFDVPRPRLLRATALPEPPCVEHVLTQDGATLVCRGEEAVSAWQVRPLAPLWSKPLRAERLYLDDASGSVVLSSREAPGRLVSLRLQDGALQEEIPSDEDKGLLFTDDAQTIVSLSDVFVKTLRGGGPLTRYCQGRSAAAGLGLEGGRLALVCADGALEIHDARGLSRRTALELGAVHPKSIHLAVASPDERWMVLGSLRGDLLLVDLEAGEVVRRSASKMGALRDLHLSPDVRVLAVAGERGGVHLWHVASGAWLDRLPDGDVRQVRFIDEETLQVLGERIERWQVPKALSPMYAFSEGGFSALAFSRDGDQLCAASSAGRLLVWSLTEAPSIGLGEVRATREAERQGVAKDCVFSLDSERVLGSSMGMAGVRVFEASGLSEQAVLMPGEWGQDYPYFRRVGVLEGGLVFGLGYMPSGPDVWRLGEAETLDALRVPGRTFWEGEGNHAGSAAVLLDDEGQVYLLRPGAPPTLRSIVRREGLSAADVSSDGAQVALATERRVELLSAEGAALGGLGPSEQAVMDVAFSADDRVLAVAQMGGVVQLWDVESGSLLAVLRGHQERVASVAFSPDGRRLATASWDGVVRLWSLESLRLEPTALLQQLEEEWQLTLERALTAELR